MAAYLFTNDRLKCFDATGDIITLNYAGQPVDHIGNVATTKTDNGLPNDMASPPK